MDIFTVSFSAILQWYVHCFAHEIQEVPFHSIIKWNNCCVYMRVISFSERSCNILKEAIIWKASRREIIKRRLQWGWTFVMKTFNWDHRIWLSDSNTGTPVPNGSNSFLLNSCIINHTQKFYTENQSRCFFFFCFQRSIFFVSHAAFPISNNEQWHWTA